MPPPDRLRALLLADSCNPEWPSLPVVGYKYARALAEVCDVTVATHVRNRENIEKAGDRGWRVVYVDNEYVAAPLYRLATWMRGGEEVAWSTNMMMAYPAYVAFEWEVMKRFRSELEAGAFDVVHRLTPMSPTLPSWIAGRTPQPFVLGPLNGNLDWPDAYRAEMAREREGLRRLRGLYRHLPFARRTMRRSDAILAAFRHTAEDLDAADPARIVSFPEVGFDAGLFRSDRPAEPNRGKLKFLFAGRLVPYKLSEAAVRAFAESEELRRHSLHIVGDGPERPRLEALIARHSLEDCVRLEGRFPQAEVADWMRRCDVFVFPSIRELGAGVVVEAMASEMFCVVVDYGAPGALVAEDRGAKEPLAPLDALTPALRAALERAAADRDALRRKAAAARRYAEERFSWEVKARMTEHVYRWVLRGAPPEAKPTFY
jgi:glycosyltransferase involved in cell wall biosynthesis